MPVRRIDRTNVRSIEILGPQKRYFGHPAPEYCSKIRSAWKKLLDYLHSHSETTPSGTDPTHGLFYGTIIHMKNAGEMLAPTVPKSVEHWYESNLNEARWSSQRWLTQVSPQSKGNTIHTKHGTQQNPACQCLSGSRLWIGTSAVRNCIGWWS